MLFPAARRKDLVFLRHAVSIRAVSVSRKDGGRVTYPTKHDTLMIEQIRAKIQAGQFEFSKHAVDQSILRQISVQELREAIASGEIIEDYPEDKYGPSCLVLGFTQAGRPLHIQSSYPSRPLIKIITLYEPDPAEWADFRIRRT